MSFFEYEPEDIAPVEPGPEPVSPPWFGPPAGVIPTPLLARATIFKTDTALFTLEHLDVYPTGIEFTLYLRLRTPLDWHGIPWEPDGRKVSADNTEFLRLGFEFPDGSKWTNLPGQEDPFGQEPDGPFVMNRGGGGGGSRWEMKQWIWPLPTAGDLVIHSAWPALGIDETSTAIDTKLFTKAAAKAEQLPW